jgi:hypothetical protein
LDTSNTTIGSINPSIKVEAITVSTYSHNKPGPFRFDVEQIYGNDGKLTWNLGKNETLMISGGSIEKGNFSCNGSPYQVCVLFITSSKDQTVEITGLYGKDNWIGVSESSPNSFLQNILYRFWEAPNCISGCDEAKIGIFEDDTMISTSVYTPQPMHTSTRTPTSTPPPPLPPTDVPPPVP